ncbi:MAG: ankyrin repeat domain-containing protein [Pseudolabrys sp.]|jgi:ankyrin repeat protein|nr:ankyrin repeat domain-containing protein [Pseudolabrys sp.]
MLTALTTVTRAALGAALFLCATVTMTGPAMADAKTDQALIDAAGRGDAGAVRRLLGEGASVAARDGQGRTALLAATHAAPGVGTEAARLLIAAGADVNAKDRIEDSPYLYAAAEGRNDILKMTLAHGADLKSTNRYGGTGLIPAAHHGHPETVRILLGTAIDKDHVNKLGWTALLEAVILGDGGPVHTEIVGELVRAGASVTIADRDGVTPLAHARRRGYAAMAAILEGAGGR